MASYPFHNASHTQGTIYSTAPRFGPTTTAMEVVRGFNARLDGKVVIITGGTSGKHLLFLSIVVCISIINDRIGLGVETARALATTNAHVIITARDMNRGKQVVEDIKKATRNNRVEVMELDLNSLKSVRDFVNRFRQRRLPVNILICK